MHNKLLTNFATPYFRNCKIHKFCRQKSKKEFLGENAIFDKKSTIFENFSNFSVEVREFFPTKWGFKANKQPAQFLID